VARVDARYRGQSFELDVPAESWVDSFHAGHEARYGFRRPDSAVEAVTVRVSAVSPGVALEPERIPAHTGSTAVTHHRFTIAGEEVDGGFVDRAALSSGATLSGPLVISGYGSTTWVPMGWSVEVDSWGCLLLNRSDEGERPGT